MKKKRVQIKLPICPCTVCEKETSTCDCAAWYEWFKFTWPYLTKTMAAKKGK